MKFEIWLKIEGKTTTTTTMNSNIINELSKRWADLKLFREDFRNWEKLSPTGKMDCFVNIGNGVSKSIGVYIFDKCQLNFYTYFPAAVLGIYFILALYTIVKNTLSGNITGVSHKFEHSVIESVTMLIYIFFLSKRDFSAMFKRLSKIVSKYKQNYFYSEKFTTTLRNQLNTIEFSERASKTQLHNSN